MAAIEKVNTRLQLVFEDGVDAETGEPILKSKSFNNVKTTATADSLLAIATSLVPLQQRTLHEIKQNDSSIITAE